MPLPTSIVLKDKKTGQEVQTLSLVLLRVEMWGPDDRPCQVSIVQEDDTVELSDRRDGNQFVTAYVTTPLPTRPQDGP